VALAVDGPTAEEVYSSLIVAQPDLFYPAMQALTLVGYALLERVSSLLFHFSWGYLCILAACAARKRYLMLALPMGLVDFFVPFAGTLGTLAFEVLIFLIGLGCLGSVLVIAKRARQV